MGAPEIGMVKLPLDDHQRHACAGHLDRVGVLELVGREPTAYSGETGGIAELDTNPGA